jgi:DNA-binding NtrC family response regulator
LDPRDDGIWIRDLGSRNGTWLEGVRVKEALVPPGGKLRIGATVLSFGKQPVQQRVELWQGDRLGGLVGKSRPMRELFATLARLAQSDSTVLITGETGTGKELAAHAIHEASKRANAPFVIVDCAALPEQLFESELFGHTKGAFTGATTAQVGAIEAAEGGTVFLDEVGELPLVMQPKLLRALESRTLRRLGEATHRKFDVRFLSATHRDFREDLYFRLAVVPISMPPLRERPGDIGVLLERFLPDMTPAERESLAQELSGRPWYGNVRELKNLVERAAVFGTDAAIAMSPGSSTRPQDVGADGASFELPFREYTVYAEREYLRRLMDRCRGDTARAAKVAGVDRTYIYRLLRKHAL